MSLPIPIPNLSASSQSGGGEITGSIFGGIHKGSGDFPFSPPAAIAGNSLKNSSSETIVLLGAMALAGFILLKKKGK